MAERITDAQVEDYRTSLQEPSRPPSRGGNTGAMHQHVIFVGGQRYSFRALGSQRWVFKSDRVSFEYELNGPYRNVITSTLKTIDAKGREVVRGNRGSKPRLRTAPARLPASRREQRD